MTCHDGPPAPFTLLEAREQIDRLTRFMCEAVYLLERIDAKASKELNGVPLRGTYGASMLDRLSLPAQAWVRQHKAIDAQREQIEKHFKEVKESALAKLTRDEQMVLGVGDWNMKDYE